MNFKPLNISAEFVCRIVFYFGRWNRLISTLDCHLCCNFVVIIQWPCVLRSVWLMMVEMHTALQLLVHQIPSPPFDRRGYENTMEAHGCWRNGMKNPLLFKIRALFLSFIHPQPPPSAFLHAPSHPPYSKSLSESRNQLKEHSWGAAWGEGRSVALSCQGSENVPLSGNLLPAARRHMIEQQH